MTTDSKHECDGRYSRLANGLKTSTEIDTHWKVIDRKSYDELVAALERAFVTFGRFGGNHVSDLYAQTVKSQEIRAAWLDARDALAKVTA